MTSADRWDPPTPATRHREVHGTDLAGALVHLLARDDEIPARWRSTTFATAVEARRVELQAIRSQPELLAAIPQPTGSFARTAAILARDPGPVATAIRQLELASGGRFPSWLDLVRRSTRPLALDFDASLWFG